MKKNKLLCIILSAMIITTLFAGCGKSKSDVIEGWDDPTESTTETTETTTEVTDEAETTETSTTTQAVIKDTSEDVEYIFTGDIKATKLATITGKNISTQTYGVVYMDENEKYGIISLDGSKDTGAIYGAVAIRDGYFVVSDKKIENFDNMTEVNSMGLVSPDGELIVDKKYAGFNVLSEKYVVLYTAKAKVTSKNDALIYFTDRDFALYPDDDDTFFSGEWEVYDLETNSSTGIKGTTARLISAYGDFISYYDEEDNKIVKKPNGKTADKNATFFENGCYELDDGYSGAVYNPDGETIFEFYTDSFVPFDMMGDYYMARKYADGTSTYAMLDSNGKIVSIELENSPEYFNGKILYANDKVTDPYGNPILEGDYKYFYEDELYGYGLIFENDEKSVLLDTDGNLLCEMEKNDTTSVSSGNFTFSKKENDTNMVYSLKDKQFCIEGYGCAPWLVEVSGENYTEDIVSVITGETLIEGYGNYMYVEVEEKSEIYVYAYTENGNYDIYLIK